MGNTERIKAYIAKTKIPDKLSLRYDCYADELQALLAENNPFAAVCLAFSYGKAKGYRAGRKSVTA